MFLNLSSASANLLPFSKILFLSFLFLSTFFIGVVFETFASFFPSCMIFFVSILLIMSLSSYKNILSCWLRSSGLAVTFFSLIDYDIASTLFSFVFGFQSVVQCRFHEFFILWHSWFVILVWCSLCSFATSFNFFSNFLPGFSVSNLDHCCIDFFLFVVFSLLSEIGFDVVHFPLSSFISLFGHSFAWVSDSFFEVVAPPHTVWSLNE